MTLASKLAKSIVEKRAAMERHVLACPIPCFTVDADGRALSVNSKFKSVFGVDCERINDRKWANIIDGNGSAEYLETLSQCAKGRKAGFTLSLECQVEGESRPAMLRIVSAHDRFTGYISFTCCGNFKACSPKVRQRCTDVPASQF